MAATVNISRIVADPNNIRTKVSVKPIEGLADSIAEIGLQQPIVVYPHEGGYKLLFGHRRFAALAQLADAKRHSGELEVDREIVLRSEVPDEGEIVVSQLVENLQREDIDALDEAAGYMRLLEFDMSQADIARKVGRSRAHVTKRLALLSLPEKAKTALRKDDITIEHALNIAALDAEDAEEFCKGDLHNQHTLLRLHRGQKGKKVAVKFAKDLEATGLQIVSDFAEAEAQAPDDQHYETMEYIYADQWDGSVPTDSEIAVVTVQGEQASAKLYKLVPNTSSAAASSPDKAAEKEKARRKEERLANQAKTDFLTGQLARVKAKDADEIALSLALDRVGYSNAREICVLLDLEVPVKETTTYDGKTRNEKQYAPLVMSMVKEARENGDVGFIRRVVLAVACTYGYSDRLLERFGYDPDATTTEDDG